MASLRFLSFPSTTTLSITNPVLLSVQPQTHFSSLSIFPSSSLSALSLSILIKPTSQFLFNCTPVSSSTPLTVETPEEEKDEVDESESGGDAEEEEFSRTRLLAQNVPWTSTADDIRALFQKYGTVIDVELSMYNKTRNRGLAFVSMSSPEEALAALNNLESYEYEGRTLKLNYARPRKKKPSSAPPKSEMKYDLFVGNLPYDAKAKDVKEFFNSSNANVVSAEIIYYDTPRRPSGYGFVSFSSKEEAAAALSAFQGRTFMGRPLRLAHSRRKVTLGATENAPSEGTLSDLNPGMESDNGD
ncbi:RNA recognition motif domain [Dillenia turbinata]|uniref:RNA recognition motif domain n=1 Tax=Dillenia turbinata TaxID=194707 RepID=A0AAN8ZJJ3_9MAGN